MRVACVGGIDPTGGAGLARDATALASVGATPLLVVTALTIQSEAGVSRVEPVSADLVRASLRAALEAGAAAVKIGMLAEPSIVDAVAEVLEERRAPTVLDPVLSASAGGSLAGPEVVGALGLLRPWVTVVTPNLSEARILANDADAEAGTAAAALLASGWNAVVVTGGDFEEAGEAADVLALPERMVRLVAPRSPGPSPRGTGCAFASILAAGLGAGAELEEAARRAKGAITQLVRDGAGGFLAVTSPSVWPHAGHPFE